MTVAHEEISPLEYIVKRQQNDPNCPQEYQTVLENLPLRFLLRRCFDFNYNRRPSAIEIASDPFFKAKARFVKTQNNELK